MKKLYFTANILLIAIFILFSSGCGKQVIENGGSNGNTSNTNDNSMPDKIYLKEGFIKRNIYRAVIVA